MKATKGTASRSKRLSRRTRGTVIVLALTVLTPLVVAGGSMLQTLRSYGMEVEDRSMRVASQLIAASGAHDALGTLEQNIAYRGEYELELSGGETGILVRDSDPGDPSNDLIEIRSEGWMNRPLDQSRTRRGVKWTRSVVQATARPLYTDLSIEQVVYLHDRKSKVKVSGNSFEITGHDGASDPADPVAGIGTPGDPADLLAQLAGQQLDNVDGSGGPGSVLETPEVDIPEMIDALASRATMIWTEPDASASEDLGSASDPVLAHAVKDLKISGNLDGAGVLMVSGDLDVSGNIDYRGLILVGGNASFKGGGSGTALEGALLVNGQGKGDALTVTGSVQLRYDSAAVDQISVLLVTGVELVAWSQDHIDQPGSPK